MTRPKLLLRTCLALSACLYLAATVRAQQQCRPPALSAAPQGPNIFTEEQEVHLGDAIAEHIMRNFRVIDDEALTAHLRRVGERLIKHLPPSKLRYQFFLVDLPEANAFVLPGGRIYVSRKIVAFAENEDELAGVLAHEMGHLVARQHSVGWTRLLREVLGVNEVGDRRDIFEKYNRFVESIRLKPSALKRGDHEREQIVADQIGLYALAGAGYDPQASVRLWDRYNETQGKTSGGFFSDLFGTTSPEIKRLREMVKGVASLPRECVEARAAAASEEFRRWQAEVVNYRGLGRKEDLRGVVSKTELEPPLRGDITHLRFSPDGRYVLAQDDSGVNVLTREPFAQLFRIEAPEARAAQFSPDSQSVVFYNSDLRVEVWDVAGRKLKTARELVVRKPCLQTRLAPDARALGCLDYELDLNLFDVETGALLFQKKSFYTPSRFDVLLLRLFSALSDDSPEREVNWVNMNFSPDARYFAAGARSSSYNALGWNEDVSAVAYDLTARAPVKLPGQLKKYMTNEFTFVAPDRLVGVNAEDMRKSALVSFPQGQVLDEFPLSNWRLSPPARGGYVLLGPIVMSKTGESFPVGIMRLSDKTIFRVNKQPAMDIYDDLIISERVNGELGLYDVKSKEPVAVVSLPRSNLGRLRVAEVSDDFRWLAASERQRGAVWDLTKGERVFYLRGFRGGYFADDGAFYAEFPKQGEAPRAVGRMDLTKREATPGVKFENAAARQVGPYIVGLIPNGRDAYYSDVTLEVRDARDNKTLWSKSFPKESPRFVINPDKGTMVLYWATSSAAAKQEAGRDPALARRLAAMKEKEGDYYLEVLDVRTGQQTGRLLIETGKGSFRIGGVFAAGDRVVILDTSNRVLVYSLSTGEQKGQMFGALATLSVKGDLLAVENERGQLAVYDLKTMEKREQFTFSTPVALARFSPDGQKLFVLTAAQTAYVLDVSSLARASAQQD